eukprot:TRINITY_DN851_c0_g1_i11.p2 TRINITY_DN851_c0_g1~~TRINITY_DN851_c0_g1_i11.p2  ORF type:complete len:162 (-),score=13.87 TRINITY_DN851_c0_g1_i11:13-498(-)
MKGVIIPDGVAYFPDGTSRPIDASVIHPTSKNGRSYPQLLLEGASATREHNKERKYQASTNPDHRNVIPLVWDTYGAMGKHGHALVDRLAKLKAADFDDEADSNIVARDFKRRAVTGLAFTLARGNYMVLQEGIHRYRYLKEGLVSDTCYIERFRSIYSVD